LFRRENSVGKLTDWECTAGASFTWTSMAVPMNYFSVLTYLLAARSTDAFTDVLLQHEWKSGRTERWVSCKLHKLQTPISHQSQPPTVRLQKNRNSCTSVPHRHITNKNAKCHFTTVPETLSEYHEIIRRTAGLNISRPYMTLTSIDLRINNILSNKVADVCSLMVSRDMIPSYWSMAL